jgi:hypothetical protein
MTPIISIGVFLLAITLMIGGAAALIHFITKDWDTENHMLDEIDEDWIDG